MDRPAARPQDLQALHRRRVPALRVGADVRGRGRERRRAPALKDAATPCAAARSAFPELGGDDGVQPRPGALPPRRDARGAGDDLARVSLDARRSRPRSTAWSGTRAGRTSSRRCSAARTRSRAVLQLHRAGADRRRRVIAPDEPALVGLVSRLAPGARRRERRRAGRIGAHPLAAIELAEAIATSDVPVASSTSSPASVPSCARARRPHGRERDRRHRRERSAPEPRAAGRGQREARRARRGREQSPWDDREFLELKTVWHPVGQ